MEAEPSGAFVTLPGFLTPRVAGSQGVALGDQVVTFRDVKHETNPGRTKPDV